MYDSKSEGILSQIRLADWFFFWLTMIWLSSRWHLFYQIIETSSVIVRNTLKARELRAFVFRKCQTKLFSINTRIATTLNELIGCSHKKSVEGHTMTCIHWIRVNNEIFFSWNTNKNYLRIWVRETFVCWIATWKIQIVNGISIQKIRCLSCYFYQTKVTPTVMWYQNFSLYTWLFV